MFLRVDHGCFGRTTHRARAEHTANLQASAADSTGPLFYKPTPHSDIKSRVPASPAMSRRRRSGSSTATRHATVFQSDEEDGKAIHMRRPQETLRPPVPQVPSPNVPATLVQAAHPMSQPALTQALPSTTYPHPTKCPCSRSVPSPALPPNPPHSPHSPPSPPPRESNPPRPPTPSCSSSRSCSPAAWPTSPRPPASPDSTRPT